MKLRPVENVEADAMVPQCRRATPDTNGVQAKCPPYQKGASGKPFSLANSFLKP